MQIESCITLFSWQGSKISLKLDLKNSQLFLKKFSHNNLKNILKSFICRQENAMTAGSVGVRQNCNCWQQ